MDLTPLTKFVTAHWLEVGGICTLGFSLWIAFGPLRHRLPKPLTALGKYSATLKLLFLSGLCWMALYRLLTDDIPSGPINWLVGGLGTILLLAAGYVVTRKQVHRTHPSHPIHPADPRAHVAPKSGVPIKPGIPSRPTPLSRP